MDGALFLKVKVVVVLSSKLNKEKTLMEKMLLLWF